MLIETFLSALIVFALAITGMAVGVIFSNRRITGSCGGLNAITGTDRCGMCGRPAGTECAKVKERLG